MNRRDLVFRMCVALGAAAGSPTLHVLAGERPVAAGAAALFDARGSERIRVLSELIIPQTDTPGAIEAGVPAFVEMMVADWYTDTERKIFFDGLRALDTWCLLEHRRDFLQCNEAERTAALAEAERKAGSYVSRLPGGPMAALFGKQVDEHTPFFAKLKELVVIGYFHSEAGATKELSYNPMPMRYEGDYDYAATGRQWSH